MRIAVLALQGAFAEHEQMLERIGVDYFEVRQAADWQQPKDGLILPGGESTTMTKLLHDLGLYHDIQQAIQEGLPVFGTCAGLILLDRSHLGTMDIVARRNAYGRQLGSFHTQAPFKGIPDEVPMTFIRAPYIQETGKEVEVLAVVDGHIVAARQGNQLVTAFHPELDEDPRLHQYFISMVQT
jgi:5'-phosphate synthase pdxT subunit